MTQGNKSSDGEQDAVPVLVHDRQGRLQQSVASGAEEGQSVVGPQGDVEGPYPGQA